MSSEEKFEVKTGKGSNFLLEMAMGFFSSIFASFTESVKSVVEQQEKKVSKKISIVVIFFIGTIFALNGLAIFISEYLKTGNWLGYGLVGVTLIVIGLMFRR